MLNELQNRHIFRTYQGPEIFFGPTMVTLYWHALICTKLGQIVNFYLYFHKKIIKPEKIIEKGENTQILFRPTLVTRVTLVPLRVLIPVYVREPLPYGSHCQKSPQFFSDTIQPYSGVCGVSNEAKKLQ